MVRHTSCFTLVVAVCVITQMTQTAMVIYGGGGCLYYPNELFKQGIIFISSLTLIQIFDHLHVYKTFKLSFA